MSLLERVESRVLGAFRLIDSPTQAIIRRPLNVSASNTDFIRNRSYQYVIRSTAGLENHTHDFLEPPSTPALGSIDVAIHIHDPVHRYLPRVTTLALPRDPDPDHADQDTSLFQAEAVQLYVTPSFPMHPNWSGVRATLTIDGSDDEPLPGALLRIIRSSDDVVLARGVSDRRGEALVIVPGIPITNFSSSTSEDDADFDASGPVVISETAVKMEVIANDALPWPVDPDVLEANRGSWLREGGEPVLLTLRTGQVEHINIAVDLT